MCFVFKIFLVIFFACFAITDNGMDMGIMNELWYIVGYNISNRSITAAFDHTAMNAVP